MTDAPISGRRRRLGCLPRVMIGFAAAIAIFVVLGLIFDQGADAPQPLRQLNAGAASGYASGDVNYLEEDHVFVTRLADGAFVALYDRSAKQQLVGRTDCRVRFDETATTGNAAQLEGFRGVFVEECDGARAIWLADGRRITGAGFGNLDRFETEVDAAGDLIVHFDQRTCTKSAGAGGLPPFEERRCGRPED